MRKCYLDILLEDSTLQFIMGYFISSYYHPDLPQGLSSDDDILPSFPDTRLGI